MAEQSGFKRNVGLFMAVMIGIGAMMGPGIFALPSEVAGSAGPLGIIAYLAMGVLTLFTAFSYSELGAAIPIAGGGYSFTSRTLPRPVAFLTGWFFWIGNTFACSLYAVIFALTIKAYFFPEISVFLVVLATTAIFTVSNLFGQAEALKFITIMNIIELVVLLGVGILGAFQVEPANLEPFAPMGLGPLIPTMGLIYISYVGFDLITVAAEEIIDPAKTIPRAIFITLGTGIAIYVLLLWVMMGVVNYSELAETSTPFIFVADHLFGAWGRWAGILATIMASLSAFSVTLGASARVLFALGRDGHFPSVFSRLHKKYKTPHISLFVCAGLVVVLGASGVVRLLASASSFGYLIAIGIVNYTVIALHERMPNLRKPFKVILYPVVPILGIISCWFFVPTLDSQSILLGVALTAVGGILYLFQPQNRAEFSNIPSLLRTLKVKFQAYWRPHMNILIIGGGNLGTNIADRLLKQDEFRMVFRSAEYQITFIEQDDDRCEKLERRYNVPIFQGDGTKQELLEQVEPQKMDVAIAATNDDQRNSIMALQAKRLGIKRVIAIARDPDYVSLLEDSGIVCISAPYATAAMVENYLDRPVMADLFEIEGGVANLIDVEVPGDGAVVGMEIQQIDIPEECVVAAIIRDEEFVVPRGKTIIQKEDHVVVVGPEGSISKAHKIFSGTKE
ncbi:amino acid permease [Rhodohalobacter sulfatireducens]|uniref:Amino acid permease n=1 Tax=Rhodohalobacter sulfatireducens TaxID=2911366 RepID=A0ABS9KIF2_9BACT|nr:amino acid permease [Rhodohalobacter sulfatireducens]MCG2590623.1 amino acid permease [Rhodohalobacter sulfatireducens]MDR9408078.1 amino acid permease [Balneolaceae bacterium]